MKKYVFLDLDDTLFQSARKCPPNTPVTEISYSVTGKSTGFITKQQQEFLNWLSEKAEIIPTTARSINSFRRVNISFTGYAICSFGGIILTPQGNCQQEWQAYIKPLVNQYHQSLLAMAESIKKFSQLKQLDVRIVIVKDLEYDFYLNIKHNQHKIAELNQIRELMNTCMPKNWRIHSNDNNLSLLPPYLGKEYAVSWFIDRYINREDSLLITVGDSFTDAAFMALGDYAVTPPKSQLFTSLWHNLS